MRKSSSKKAFTLIELLIVVLIIAILAAIAIPNFLEFQVRAKVSRVKSDFRTMATGMEAYCVDEGTYPATDWGYAGVDLVYFGLYRLTTPIAYMTSIPQDSFGNRDWNGAKVGKNFEFGSGKSGLYASGADTYPNDTWMLESPGPDNDDDTDSSMPFASTYYPWPGTAYNTGNVAAILGIIYDPTNGTTSSGQLYRSGGTLPPEQVVTLWWQIINK
jgi:type II secretion system protein G